MAAIQWRMTSWALLAGLVFAPRLASGCHPASRELHICLNIYLERDFPLIEAIVEGQTRVGRGHIILEGPDLQNICRHISSLRDCYAPLVRECRSLWQLDRFSRVRGVLKATHDHLCTGGTDNMRDILLNSGCLTREETHLASCTGFKWWMSWREVLRMQVSPQDRCVALESYRDCLQRRLESVVCGSEAGRAYLPLFDVWLKSWCGAVSTPDEDRRYLYYSLKELDDMPDLYDSMEVGS